MRCYRNPDLHSLAASILSHSFLKEQFLYSTVIYWACGATNTLLATSVIQCIPSPDPSDLHLCRCFLLLNLKIGPQILFSLPPSVRYCDQCCSSLAQSRGRRTLYSHPTPTPTLKISVSFCSLYLYLIRDSNYCWTVSYFFILRLGKGWVSIPVSRCSNKLSSHFISPGEAAEIDKCIFKIYSLKLLLLENRAHRPKRKEQ